MNKIYSIITIITVVNLFFVFGLLFLFLIVPNRPLLHNYRTARRVMAFAYMFFACIEMLKGIYCPSLASSYDIKVIQTTTLAISFSQAFLFTYSLIVLLNIRFSRRQRIIGELIPVVICVALIFVVHFACPAAWFRLPFYVFGLLYVIQLVHYTRLFRKNCRLARLRMDNYYSGSEFERLRWIVLSFYAALVIGVMALLTALSESLFISLIFSIIFTGFYTYFAIRFINYPLLFQQIIEQPMKDVLREEPVQPKNHIKTGKEAFALLEKRIELWIANKGFIEQGITIDVLSAKLITNQKYLSTYINTYKKQTFREWINELRIEEAKILLLQYPEMTLKDISSRVGFSDKSHFLHQFKKLTDESPTNWKNIVHAQSFPILTPNQP